MFTIYNIIKRNTQGLVSSLSFLGNDVGGTSLNPKRISLPSRDKAGMKASSFLKIGVNHEVYKIIHKITCTYYIYIIEYKETHRGWYSHCSISRFVCGGTNKNRRN